MTTRSEVIEVGSTAEAGPVADLVKEWAESRGLDLANAAVLSWQLHITRASLSATTEPVKVAPYNPTEEMRWAMKRIDPALSSEQCRALWSAAWSASPSTHPAPSVPMTEGQISLEAHNADDRDWNDLRFRSSWHEGFLEGARFAESHHGITTQEGTNGEIN